MTPNTSQLIIIRYLKQAKREAKLEELYNISDRNYYCNWRKHFGDFMGTMVKSGFAKRVKPGVFVLGDFKESEPDKNQISLF